MKTDNHTQVTITEIDRELQKIKSFQITTKYKKGITTSTSTLRFRSTSTPQLNNLTWLNNRYLVTCSFWSGKSTSYNNLTSPQQQQRRQIDKFKRSQNCKSCPAMNFNTQLQKIDEEPEDTISSKQRSSIKMGTKVLSKLPVVRSLSSKRIIPCNIICGIDASKLKLEKRKALQKQSTEIW